MDNGELVSDAKRHALNNSMDASLEPKQKKKKEKTL